MLFRSLFGDALHFRGRLGHQCGRRTRLHVNRTAVTRGKPLRQIDDLMVLLTGDRVGTTVPVRLIRGGQVQEIKVTIGERA